MIQLWSWPTPNGQKVQILLEELGVPYRAMPVNILRGEQFAADFLAFSPNNKIPAIVDEDADGNGRRVTVFETGAILLYLAEKHREFIPADLGGRTEVLEWLFFQCSSLGPMLGQATHFRRYAATPVPYAVERYTAEATRLYGVLEQRLEGRSWLAGEDYSIADIASYPWIVRFRRQGQDLGAHPRLQAWVARLAARPAVLRGMDVLKDAAREVPVDAAAHATLFGRGAEA